MKNSPIKIIITMLLSVIFLIGIKGTFSFTGSNVDNHSDVKKISNGKFRAIDITP